MNLTELKTLFGQIKAENNIDKLLEHKFNLQLEEGEQHVYLHSLEPDDTIQRSETKSIIGSLHSLKSILEEKIQLVRASNKEQRRKEIELQEEINRENKKAEKKYNIEESKFVMAAKRLLDRKTYNAILNAAQNLPHNEINKMKPRNLVGLLEKENTLYEN